MKEEIEEIREQLKSISKPEKAEFIKRYLKSPYSFYGICTPDSRNLAKGYRNRNMYEVYNLFDELWNSGNHEEMSLAIHIIQQYRKNFNIETWKFLKSRLNKAVTWDHIDYLATDIFAEILKDNIYLMSEIKELANSRNPWERRLAIESTYKLIKQKKIELTLRLAEKMVYDSNEYVQKGTGWMLREAGKRDRISVREFILSHLDMKPVAFSYATEKMTELRKIRKQEKKKDFKKEKLFEGE